MDSPNSLLTTAPLVNRVREDADVAQIAEAVSAVWAEIEKTLSPIIGQRGVAKLYRRSLHLSRVAHPWMAGPPEGMDAAMDTQPLLSALLLQQRADALRAASALFQTFHDLLASLVGPSLTERLLRPVWSDSAGTPPATESST